MGLPYGQESYFDADGELIQKRKGIVFQDAPYLHVTHLKRSTKVRTYNKFKLEMGERFSKEFRYPEVFYVSYPDIVLDPFHKLSWIDFALANMMTPIRRIKRRLQF